MAVENLFYKKAMSDLLNTYLFHWQPEKAVWIAGHTLSWDARCSGIYIGFGLGVLYHFILDKRAKNLPPWTILLSNAMLFVPLFIDVFTVKYGFRPPSNDARFLTGLLFGSALSVYLYPAFLTLCFAGACKRAAIGSLHKFAGLLIIVVAGFFLKLLDNVIAYYTLEISAVLGCLSLFTMIGFGVLKCLTARGIALALEGEAARYKNIDN